MDNLACDERSRVWAALVATGAVRRYLRPYIPDLNLIKKAFSRLRFRLRAAATRTVRAVENFLEPISQPVLAGAGP